MTSVALPCEHIVPATLNFRASWSVPNLQNKVQTEHYQKQKLERDLHVIQRQMIEFLQDIFQTQVEFVPFICCNQIAFLICQT
jgi:hypothetical protein